MAVTTAQIKATFNEFDATPTALITIALDQANRWVDSIQWGTIFDDGVLWLTAHILKSLIAEDGLPPGAMTAKAVEKVSASFQAIDIHASSSLSATAYGRHFLALQRLVFGCRKV